jgi:hypothetical protein
MPDRFGVMNAAQEEDQIPRQHNEDVTRRTE